MERDRQHDSSWLAQRWLVSGRVQGVGFRYHVLRAAREADVRGDVRNLSDGRVEARVEGPAENLARLMACVRSGPPGARVESVTTEELHGPLGLDGFHIR